MALSNRDRVGRALDQLSAGLRPYFEREMGAALGTAWEDRAKQSLGERTAASRNGVNWDASALLGVMWSEWQPVFKATLGQAERTLVSELRDVRNRWAHQAAFTADDTYRALDSMHRLLTAVSAPEADELARQKQEVLRQQFEDQTRRETRRTAGAALDGTPTAGLLGWRQVVTPHADVASGNYTQAEFAADLAKVHAGVATSDYRDPRAFFQRTYVTAGLTRLLTNALQRLSGQGGEPAVKLQTNFGGGKTHSMLALYHLFSGAAPGELAGLEPVLRAVGVTTLPAVKRAVWVGTAVSPGQPQRKPDGTVVNTMWGDLAWQLAGPAGYALVAGDDQRGVNPGSNVLGDLLRLAGPSLVLIDEWVAFARQLYNKTDLPAGSFDANLTFAQSLTEAAAGVPNALVVASIPSSDIETGGDAGREALARLEHTFRRIESLWQAASTEEGFEIVRRRLFEPITDPKAFAARDAVVAAYIDLYRAQPGEFPGEVREADYARRMQAAYPIHPELFARLYNDWSTLDTFQRTRGVLRLMAAVTHALWSRGDGGLLIMPASVPIDDPTTHLELTRYLEPSWGPVIERDVDGPHSLPLRIDQENPNLGRYSATRRVARTLYIGSAPTAHTANRGIEDKCLKLGAAQPGESVATFGDALRRLADQATHLYQNGQRYWYGTQPSVNRLAQDRATQQHADDVHLEILRRLKLDVVQRGDFTAGVHVAPASSGDVPDEREVRLVVLDPVHPHSARVPDSAARRVAQEILDHRGTGARRYRNAVVFLAPDATRLKELEQAVRQYLAWKSIADEHEELLLDPFQQKQASSKRAQADEAVKQRIPETYVWLLVPGLGSPQASAADLEWQEVRAAGQEALAVRASKKLRNEELLVAQLGGTRLRMELDRVPLWRGDRGDHVAVRQLADDFAQYLYLPRLKEPDVLLGAVTDGVRLMTWAHDAFAYAEAVDATTGRYRGLRAGEVVTPSLAGDTVLVRPEAARAQLEADRAVVDNAPPVLGGGHDTRPVENGTPPGVGESRGRFDVLTPARPGPAVARPTRFFGTVPLSPERLTRDAGTIAQEVVQHLTALLGADVEITLDVRAHVPEGVPDHVVRTIAENVRTLRFSSAAFEER